MDCKKLALSLSIGIIFSGLAGCNAPDSVSSGSPGGTSQCRGVYSTRDAQGDLHKWNEYSINGQCFTDKIALTRYEASSEIWRKTGVTCTPQLQFQSRSLISANNFYQYSNGKVYLDLDSATGIFRRLILAEGKDGRPVYTRLQGCFYQRPSNIYGDQLLLDTLSTKTASSQYFDPLEIFTFTQAAPNSMEMVRFDDSADWDERFCPDLNTPWGYCDLMRNGNDLYYPVLSIGQKAAMTTEAKLIRQMYNYVTVPKAAFETVWSNPGTSRVESVRENYLYSVQAIVDTPQYIWSSWRDYLMNNRPTPPDMSGSRSPIVCFQGRRQVTLAGGGIGYVIGEICYDPALGEYHFTAAP